MLVSVDVGLGFKLRELRRLELVDRKHEFFLFIPLVRISAAAHS